MGRKGELRIINQWLMMRMNGVSEYEFLYNPSVRLMICLNLEKITLILFSNIKEFSYNCPLNSE